MKATRYSDSVESAVKQVGNFGAELLYLQWTNSMFKHKHPVDALKKEKKISKTWKVPTLLSMWEAMK